MLPKLYAAEYFSVQSFIETALAKRKIALQLSILIRNLNEAGHLKLALQSIQRQQCSFEYEIVVVDNESDDDSVQVARNAGARIITIKRDEFTYGRALNRGIASCTGDFILVLSSHIILLNEFFFEKIPGYFKEEQVAALRFVQASSPACVRESCITGPQKMLFNPEADFAVKNWNRLMINHCAAFRRSCWEMLAFDETLPDAEDKKWILEMMKQGFSMLCNVPCFYVYSKEIIREKKIRATIRGYHGKWLITGTTDPLYESSYIRSITKRLMTELRKLKTQLSIHSSVFKGIHSIQRKNTGKR